MSFEESLIHHASPTLASMKIANLYSFKFSSLEECNHTIEQFNSLMNGKGIYVELLKNTEDFYLIYVYRKSHLMKTLHSEQVGEFLRAYGYLDTTEVMQYLNILKSRLANQKDFPHEIGVFLGYPLKDVKAFVETKGQNPILCGDWKVYHDEQTARKLFGKYRHCREIYVKVYEEGRKFGDMLVSA